ncbi:MAG: aspartate-semialdehyde dehydrogenase [Bacteriovoracaceae bacterium]|jgi:aspartate-semialdehyde dehydrogenase|nr:aspartate-semialdehyde dehydrogenase [Halobacteriovoraceae bacterium]MDP7320110.1 aspartate-semialdehyde dehydrogenase [Bacteriovoracaceae bacterium]
MHKVGIVGWRGMVGSVLMERMLSENDFSKVKTYLFSTSLKGENAPKYDNCHEYILDSDSIEHLRTMDIILTCQGGDYTKDIHPKLRQSGWEGIWIDAASALRMNEDAVIVLDPINGKHIEKSLDAGIKDFIGGNCTVSLMLMGLGKLFEEDLVEWMTSMTYQAASGAGAKNMIELLEQMKFFGDAYLSQRQSNSAANALEFEKNMTENFSHPKFPKECFGHPLALSLLPWIDIKMPNEQSKEEWKAQVEANKILQNKEIVPIDGTCVRVASLRCHSQAFTLKLKKSVSIERVESLINESNSWTEVIANDKEETLQKLTPAYVTGTMKIPVGRIRKMTLGDQYLNAFSVGDQLLWGAAEPLRRVLLMALKQ